MLHASYAMVVVTQLAGGPMPTAPAPASASGSAQDIPCTDQAAEIPGVALDDPRLDAEHLIVVRKAARIVQLFSHGAAVMGAGLDQKACYRAGLGFEPKGHKTREGDGRTPEGWYTTSDKPWSSFHAAIAVHYPNPDDAAAARADGRIDTATHAAIASAHRSGRKPPQTTALGGEILLPYDLDHGPGRRHVLGRPRRERPERPRVFGDA